MTRWYQPIDASRLARILTGGMASPGWDEPVRRDDRNGSDERPVTFDPAVAIGPAGRCFDVDWTIDGEPVWLSYLASGPSEPADHREE
jgi:hypothetical protein